MREVPLNKEAHLHRLFNQRRIAYTLIEKAKALLRPGVLFSRELHEMMRQQGKFGSSDRRLYRELIYTFIRFQPWLTKEQLNRDALLDALIRLAPDTREIRPLLATLPSAAASARSSLIDGNWRARPDEDKVELLPEWFPAHADLPLNSVALDALLTRAPLWLRVQKGSTATVLAELKAALPEGQNDELAAHPNMPDCIKAPCDFSVVPMQCFQQGDIEIQDISSQALLHLLPERPVGRWFDACAGAGGKTLQLAAMLGSNGHVTAFDIRPTATRELLDRVRRAGLPNVALVDKVPHHVEFDGVLVDAPCSGSGTWRRHPFLMRQTSESEIFDHAKRQARILATYSSLVRPGGTLLYATCSLSRYENREVGDAFLARNANFARLPLKARFGLSDQVRGISIYPHHLDGDGLYMVAFKRLA